MLKVGDVQQGMFRFFVDPRAGEALRETFQRLLKVAIARFERETGIPEADVFVVCWDPYRTAAGKFVFEMALGPILATMGKGLAGATFEGGLQPDAAESGRTPVQAAKDRLVAVTGGAKGTAEFKFSLDRKARNARKRAKRGDEGNRGNRTPRVVTPPDKKTAT